MKYPTKNELFKLYVLEIPSNLLESSGQFGKLQSIGVYHSQPFPFSPETFFSFDSFNVLVQKYYNTPILIT